MLVNANHLQLNLQGHQVLRDVSLHLQRGEIYGLLGPNGAGKSTTIAVLLGLYPADKGDLKLFGVNSGNYVALRRRIGVMPELSGFYEWMSANDYLVWYAGFYGGLQQSVAELLQRVGLEATDDKPIGQFSRGMKQRLALARALAHGPELLILDEPTNGLDPRGRREIHDLLLELVGESQVGILLCTHLLDDVERLCSKIGIIDRGHSVAEGSLPKLLGDTQTGRRYRLRISHTQDVRYIPAGLQILGREGDWWHLEVSPILASDPSRVWRDLITQGWCILEIHAESGGMEELYLQLTDTSATTLREEAA
ncbi:MAG TPA: ABC transporter ATP-binding protein [Gammaproteobacteria bacterium]|nr:ABC transporter ATP-binding protein [Gammaproteobacteria bacterium]